MRIGAFETAFISIGGKMGNCNVLYRAGRRFGLVILVVACLAPAASSALPAVQDTLGFELAPVKKGDRCIVCNMPVDSSGMAILYRGRRVPFYSIDMLQRFLDNPDAYFYKLEPNGALFQEAAVSRQGLQPGWFIFGLWVVLALVSASLSAVLALRKGLPVVKWYFIGLAASLIGVLFVWRKPAVAAVELPPGFTKPPATPLPIKCPACGAENHPSAKVCSACGNTLQPLEESEVERVGGISNQ